MNKNNPLGSKNLKRTFVWCVLCILFAASLISPFSTQVFASQNTQPLLIPNPALQYSGEHHSFIVGFSDGSFRPEATITRAQAATIFFRLMSDTDRTAYWMQQNPFIDVEINSWYNNAISTTASAGLISGMPDGSFRPNRPITRAEFAVIITNITNVAHYSMPLFCDIHGHWAEEEINAAAHHGWINGYEGLGGRFLPDQAITRAEAAAIICRAYGRRPNSPSNLLTGMHIFTDNTNPSAWYYLYIQEAANSHKYVMMPDGIYEAWEELIYPERPWALLELPTAGPLDILR